MIALFISCPSPLFTIHLLKLRTLRNYIILKSWLYTFSPGCISHLQIKSVMAPKCYCVNWNDARSCCDAAQLVKCTATYVESDLIQAWWTGRQTVSFMSDMTTDEAVMTCGTSTASETFTMTTAQITSTVCEARTALTVIWTNWTYVSNYQTALVHNNHIHQQKIQY